MKDFDSLTFKEKQEIAETLLGSCMLPMDLEDEYECDSSAIELAAGQMGVETCASCGWWVDEWEIEMDEITCLDCYNDR